MLSGICWNWLELDSTLCVWSEHLTSSLHTPHTQRQHPQSINAKHTIIYAIWCFNIEESSLSSQLELIVVFGPCCTTMFCDIVDLNKKY